MRKINFKLLLVLSLIIFTFFFIYSIFINKKKLEQKIDLETKEESFTNSNILKNIKYSSKDLKGNEYVILAEQGEIDYK